MIPSRAGGFEAIGCGGHRPLTEAAFVATEDGRRGLSMRLLALDGRIVVYTDVRENWQACMTADEALHFDGRID